MVGLGLLSRPLLPPFADEVPVMVPEVDAARRCFTAAERDAATRRVDDCATARTILPVVQYLLELYKRKGQSQKAVLQQKVYRYMLGYGTELACLRWLAGTARWYVIIVYVRQEFQPADRCAPHAQRRRRARVEGERLCYVQCVLE